MANVEKLRIGYLIWDQSTLRSLYVDTRPSN